MFLLSRFFLVLLVDNSILWSWWIRWWLGGQNSTRDWWWWRRDEQVLEVRAPTKERWCLRDSSPSSITRCPPAKGVTGCHHRHCTKWKKRILVPPEMIATKQWCDGDWCGLCLEVSVWYYGTTTKTLSSSLVGNVLRQVSDSSLILTCKDAATLTANNSWMFWIDWSSWDETAASPRFSTFSRRD